MPHTVEVHDGLVVMTGYISGEAVFEGGVSLDAGSGTDAFVSAHAADDGAFEWAFRLGDVEAAPAPPMDLRTEDGFDLDVTADGEILVTGAFSGSIDLDPAAEGDAVFESTRDASGEPSRDIFVAAYDLAGGYLWGFAVGGPGQDHGHAIRAAGDGVLVAGLYSETVDFDPGPAAASSSAVGTFDAFIVRYARTGSPSWVVTFGGPGTDQVRPGALEIMPGPAGETLLVGGDFNGTVDVDPLGSGAELTSAGAGDIFLARYRLDGALLWARSAAGPTGLEFIHRAAHDGAGTIYATGQISGTVDFSPDADGGSVTTVGRTDSYLAAYGPDGELLWASAIGGDEGDEPAGEVGTGIAVDPAGVTYATGKFAGTADLDPTDGEDLRDSAGGMDAYVVRVTPL
jgi:hypothetical protein